jgi:hypothetical protein
LQAGYVLIIIEIHLIIRFGASKGCCQTKKEHIKDNSGNQGDNAKNVGIFYTD